MILDGCGPGIQESIKIVDGCYKFIGVNYQHILVYSRSHVSWLLALVEGRCSILTYTTGNSVILSCQNQELGCWRSFVTT